MNSKSMHPRGVITDEVSKAMHPFEFVKLIREDLKARGDGYLVGLVNWREITETEYELYERLATG